jgi:hypothetical protein
MSNSETALQAIKLKGHIGPDRKLEITESSIDLPEGDVEIILLYLKKRSDEKFEHLTPLTWPTLNGGRYLGGTLRRVEIYGDDGR